MTDIIARRELAYASILASFRRTLDEVSVCIANFDELVRLKGLLYGFEAGKTPASLQGLGNLALKILGVAGHPLDCPEADGDSLLDEWNELCHVAAIRKLVCLGNQ